MSDARDRLFERARGHARGALGVFVVAPLFESVDEALDWFHERGVAEPPRVWVGPDGLIRATALTGAP